MDEPERPGAQKGSDGSQQPSQRTLLARYYHQIAFDKNPTSDESTV